MSYKSVWDFGRDAKVSGIHAEGEYPSKILPHAAHEVVLRFSGEGDIVLDPFCGSGTFGLEATALNRNSINYDINPNAVNLLKKRISEMKGQARLSDESNNCPACQTQLKEPIKMRESSFIAEVKDARNLGLQNESIDCVITDIPYASMIKYSNLAEDMSTIEDYNLFLDEIQKSFNEIWRVLKKDKYCTIFVADYRVGAARKIYPLHADVINIMREIGFTLFDLYVWRYYRSGLFRPFGKRPFQAMNVHSYILVFHKPSENGESTNKNRDVRFRKRLIEKIGKNNIKENTLV